MMVKRGKFEVAFDISIYIFMAVIAGIAMFPLWNIFVTSISGGRAISSGEVFLFPVDATIDSYRQIVKDGQIFIAMKNTVIITGVGTLLNMAATTMAAYPLSKKRLKGRNSFLMIITFTMLFSGGMIPNFIVVKSLGLMNSYWSVWLMGLINTFLMFVMKSFFEGIPASLEESASLDGANDIIILFRIILPLSLPIMATLVLYYAVGWWNSYFSVLMYITSSRKLSLMVKLKQMIDSLMFTDNNYTELGNYITPEGVKTASIIVATLPILIVYPFLQKYFMKGMMVGSIKG